MPNPGIGQGDEPDDTALVTMEPEAELALADGEERLPWLESDDDYEPAGADTGRMIAIAAAGLLAIVVVLGSLWWFLRREPAPDLVADGSVIEAPEEPYKVRPENPGGTQVAGTGDTSFQVGEGKEIEGRIAETGSVAVPSIDRDQAEEPPAEPASTGGVGVQVGAYSNREQAEAGWSTLTGRHEILQGRSHRVVQAVVDSGIVYRLQAVAGNVEDAETLCRNLKSSGADCQVKR